jgi:hypothetical protein
MQSYINISDLAIKGIFFALFYRKIWSYKKKAVPLQPISGFSSSAGRAHPF